MGWKEKGERKEERKLKDGIHLKTQYISPGLALGNHSG
jgi:hypothetical protein